MSGSVLNLQNLHTLSLVIIIGLTLIAASSIINIVMSPRDSSGQFSELWLLGPSHRAEDYPFDVSAGETYNVYVGVNNHMDSTEQYKVYIKFCNGTRPLPDSEAGITSLSPLYEYQFVVEDDETWESLTNFGFSDIVVESDVLSVGEMTINGTTFPVDVSAVWDSENEGYLFQLFFELWRYDSDAGNFSFDSRFVGIWFNVAAS